MQNTSSALVHPSPVKPWINGFPPCLEMSDRKSAVEFQWVVRAALPVVRGFTALLLFNCALFSCFLSIHGGEVLREKGLETCQIGTWSEYLEDVNSPTSEITPAYHGRFYRGESREHQSTNQQMWKKQACPAESTIFNCYLQGHPNARSIDKREWISMTDESSMTQTCIQFYPYDFLTRFRDRTIVFIGDSITRQVWRMLVCSLIEITPSKLTLDWRALPKWEKYETSSKMCPFETEENCNLDTGLAIFPAAKIIVALHSVISYHEYSLSQAVGEHYLDESNDIVIYNMGVHSSDGQANQLRHKIAQMNEDFADLVSKNRAPNVFFMESLPQHFPGLSSGYFSHQLKQHESQDRCAPMADLAVAKSQDWRSIAVLEDLDPRIGFIKVADQLRTQWDAHLARYSSGGVKTDCTHYCSPSGELRYVLRVIYNTILNTLAPPSSSSSSSASASFPSTTTARTEATVETTEPCAAAEGGESGEAWSAQQRHQQQQLEQQQQQQQVEQQQQQQQVQQQEQQQQQQQYFLDHVPKAEDFLPDIPIFRDGTLLRYHRDRVVYFIEKKRRRPVESIDVFFTRGWDLEDDVIVLQSRVYLDLLEDGEPLTS